MYYLQLFLQLLFTSLAFAAPVHATKETAWQEAVGGGVVGLIIFILDVIVWIEVLKSDRPTTHKLLWALGVFFFPLIGIIVYWLFSNREAHKKGYEPIG